MNPSVCGRTRQFLRRTAVLLMPTLVAGTSACGGAGGITSSTTTGGRDSVAAPSSEARALWVTRFEYDSPQKIAQIMDDAGRAHLNVVFFQVRGAADALYRSSIEPCAAALCGKLGGTPTWDPLDVAVREAHARGMQLHAWLNAFTALAAGTASSCATLVEPDIGNPRPALLEHPEWRMVAVTGVAEPCPNGEEYVWVSPGYAAVRTRLARVAADIARRYPVDGIHLDRIRYPGISWSYDSASLRSFGQSPTGDPAAWNQFRRDQVSAAVRETYDSVSAVGHSAGRKIALSAAVWGIYHDKWSWNSSQGYDQYFQDPHAWARGGYLDVAVPMTYWATTPTTCAYTDWACLLADHLQAYQTDAGRHLYMGLAASVAQSKGLDEIGKEIALGRKAGVAGFSIYSYSSASGSGQLAYLAAGPFKTQATPPVITW